MAENYVAVSRIKVGGRGTSAEYIERGESISKSDLSEVDGDFDELVRTEAVLTEKKFDAAFPDFDREAEEGANDATGTPSNLAPVSGTALAAADDGKNAGTGDAAKAVKDGDASKAPKA
jgi:hypothetical protein